MIKTHVPRTVVILKLDVSLLQLTVMTTTAVLLILATEKRDAKIPKSLVMIKMYVLMTAVTQLRDVSLPEDPFHLLTNVLP
jgi:hypothetical protein